MRLYKKVLWIFVIGFISIQFLSSAPIKVFILAGQSNMVGTGNIMDLPEELKEKQEQVMIYNTGTGEYGWINLEPGIGAYTGSFGPEVTFGRDMALAYPGETIALVKIAWSGTSLAYDWCPPSAEGTLGRLYTEFVDNVWNALVTYPGGDEIQIMGMCWMQGESDATNIYPASDYEANLTCFINDVRAEFNLPQMPFIIAMIDRTATWPEYEIVRQAQVNVSQNMQNIGIFDTDAYPTDGSHYYSEGLILMGEDFASTMLTFLSGSITPTPTPTNYLGDVNGDLSINIIDALLVAQYYVGLDPEVFITENADTDCSNSINIVDALLIAQYYVGLISGFC